MILQAYLVIWGSLVEWFATRQVDRTVWDVLAKAYAAVSWVLRNLPLIPYAPYGAVSGTTIVVLIVYITLAWTAAFISLVAIFKRMR